MVGTAVGGSGLAVGTAVGAGGIVGIDAAELTGALVGTGVGVAGITATSVAGSAAARSGVDVSAGLDVGANDEQGGIAARKSSDVLVARGAKTELRANMPKPPTHTHSRSTPAIAPIRNPFRPFDLAAGATGGIAGTGSDGTTFGFGSSSAWISAMSASTSL